MVMTPRRRILIVDDSETVRTQSRQILSDTFDCLFASNGQEGLEIAIRELPDAVLTDIEMPIMTGVEFLRELRANPVTKEIPAIVITTVTAIELVNECRSLGCSGFVLKPLVKDYVLAKLGQLLRTRGK